MKIYKIAPIVALFLMITATGFAQQAEKTLVKAFNLKGHQLVEVQLDGPAEVRTWKQKTLRIQLQVRLENGSEALLKSFVQIGRYNMKAVEGAEGMEIVAPNLDRKVKIGGELIKESYSFVIYAPEGVQVKLPNEASTHVEEADLPTSL